MKIQTFAQIFPEGIPEITKDYSTDISTITRSINQIGLSVNQLAANNVSVEDNLKCLAQVVTTYYGKTLNIKSSFPTPPKYIVVGRVKSPSNLPATAAITSAVQVLDWFVDNNNNITIVGTNTEGKAIGLIGLPNTAGVPPKDSSNNPYPFDVTLLIFY